MFTVFRKTAAPLALLLIALLAPAGGAAAQTASAPGAARIWVYRDYEPYVSVSTPYVRFNGAVVGISQGGGSFYRDVAPGRYLITADSLGEDVNQFATVDVVPGETVYIKIQSSSSWLSGGGGSSFGGGGGWARDTFYTRLMPAQLAQQEIAHTPPYGGG